MTDRSRHICRAGVGSGRVKRWAWRVMKESRYARGSRDVGGRLVEQFSLVRPHRTSQQLSPARRVKEEPRRCTSR